MIVEHFDELRGDEGLIHLDENSLGNILIDDGLLVRHEEFAFEVVIKWMQGGADGLRGQSLLRHVRFGIMGESFLMTRAREILDCENQHCVEPYLREALNLISGTERL
jgi:hypothetical protein